MRLGAGGCVPGACLMQPSCRQRLGLCRNGACLVWKSALRLQLTTERGQMQRMQACSTDGSGHDRPATDPDLGTLEPLCGPTLMTPSLKPLR